MSYASGRMDDLRRRSSITHLDTSPINHLPFEDQGRHFSRNFRTSSLALPPERTYLNLLVREQPYLHPVNVSRMPPTNQLPRRHSAHYCPPESNISMPMLTGPKSRDIQTRHTTGSQNNESSGHKKAVQGTPALQESQPMLTGPKSRDIQTRHTTGSQNNESSGHKKAVQGTPALQESQVPSQPPPIPLRPPAVPERSKIGPPPKLSGSLFQSGQGPGNSYQSIQHKQLPTPMQNHSIHPQLPPIPAPHLPPHPRHQQSMNPPQIQNSHKPKKILPTVPPQTRTIQQSPQVASNKQNGTMKIIYAQNQITQGHTKQLPSIQNQTKQTQIQNQVSQREGKQIPNINQTAALKQLPNPQNLVRNKQQNIPAQLPPQPQQPLKLVQQTQPVQQQAYTIPQQQQNIDQQTFNNACIDNDNKMATARQDSNVSSDSFSQNSSPSYTTKTMETPLLPHHGISSKSSSNQYHKVGGEGNKILNSSHGETGNGAAITGNDVNGNGNAALTKSISTPASLQTIVRFHHGSNMSLHHRIIRDMRRPSAHYVTRGRLRFRFAQVLINAVALLAIAGGLAAYFRAYPSTVRYVNKTVTTTARALAPQEDPNPAPGICLPVIVSFCQYHRVPYNFTMFPNYMGHFTQRDAQQELEVYDAVVDVRCYELAALFLCSVFVPKCGPTGQLVRPCRSICYETKRRCGFFLDVFGLSLPDYLDCQLFPESADSDVCVGHQEVIDAKIRAQQPVCNAGFQCDSRRCIPADWRCDGHVDCEDQSDELNCETCAKGMIHCGEKRCMAQSHMCDGVVDCPWGQDERNCLRLSERMGDLGKGKLEIFQPEHQKWHPACVTHWDNGSSANYICSQLGYMTANNSRLTEKKSEKTFPFSVANSPSIWKLYKEKQTNLLKELRACPDESNYPNVDLLCSNYVCGKRRQPYNTKASTRIVGGSESSPGDWPFLAAILGGPEEIFYCAGVLISDQWVLTASHCVGNQSSQSNPDGWTIQLGITRRYAHSYFGQKMKVKRVIPHPMYNMGVAHDNDVALFQLKSRVTFHEHLLPVCLPPPNHDLVPGTKCTVIGWGKKEDKDASEYEPAVNEVEVPLLNRELCNTWLQHRDLNVTEGMICAGYPEGGKDACQGDSGGPLLCLHHDRWFVGGIVSWGIKCAHPHLPGVYAYVPKYVPWIKQQMALHSNDDNELRS